MEHWRDEAACSIVTFTASAPIRFASNVGSNIVSRIRLLDLDPNPGTIRTDRCCCSLGLDINS
jgi:hypothetical protein